MKFNVPERSLGVLEGFKEFKRVEELFIGTEFSHSDVHKVFEIVVDYHKLLGSVLKLLDYFRVVRVLALIYSLSSLLNDFTMFFKYIL